MRAIVLAGVIATALGILAPPARGQSRVPESFDGHVVEVLSGDTLVVVADGTRYEVHLFGIDAPEEDQHFHDEAIRALSELTLSRRVHVDVRERTRSGHVRGLVREGTQLVNRMMIEKGAAWYDSAQAESATLKAVQDSAQQQRLGLWATAEQQVAPWVFRDQKSEAAKQGDERQKQREQQAAAAAAEFLSAWEKGSAPDRLLTSKAKNADHSKKRLPEALEGARLIAGRVQLKGNSADVAVSITKGSATLQGTLRLHSEKRAWLVRAFTHENPPAVLDFENPQNEASKLITALDAGFERAKRGGANANLAEGTEIVPQGRDEEQGQSSRAPAIAIAPDERDIRKLVLAAGFDENLNRSLPLFVRFGSQDLALKNKGDQFDRIEANKAAEQHRNALREKKLILNGLQFTPVDRSDIEDKGLFVNVRLPLRVRGEEPFYKDESSFSGSLATMHPAEANTRTYAFLRKDGTIQPCEPADASVVRKNDGILYHGEMPNTHLLLVFQDNLDALKALARNSADYLVEIEVTGLCIERPLSWGYFRIDALVNADWDCQRILFESLVNAGDPQPAYFATSFGDERRGRIPEIVRATLTSLRVVDKDGRLVGAYKFNPTGEPQRAEAVQPLATKAQPNPADTDALLEQLKGDAAFGALNSFVADAVGPSLSSKELGVRLCALNDLARQASMTENEVLDLFKQSLEEGQRLGLDPALSLGATQGAVAFRVALEQQDQ